MCLGDWRLGRMVRAIPHNDPVAAGNIVIQPNPQRVGLSIFSDDNGNELLINQIDSLILTGAGMLISEAGRPWHATLLTHGDLPTRLISVVNTGGPGVPIQWIEYFIPEAVFQKATKWLEKEGFF